MPPRIRSSKFASLPRPSPSLPQCTRPQSITHSTPSSRQFSQTPCQQATLRRRRFYEWLNGPGKQLKEPLPGSTNYLGAYDRYGVLVRAPEYQREAAELQKAGETKLTETVNKAAASAEETKTSDGQESLQALEDAARQEQSENEGEESGNSVLPPEDEQDLRPFPNNHWFISQPVLSEDLREAIFHRVKRDGATVSLASVEFRVSNERVGAVVRLKQMEKEWIAQGKILATPYSKAVLAMLPTTPYVDPSKPENRSKRPFQHEPINDLIVHPATRQQLWVPVAESRRFTREDAGKAFDNSLLPADERIPHPELVKAERELSAGLSFDERRKLAEERLAVETAQKKREEEARQAEIRAQKVVPQRRWDFVFKDISVESAGRNGRDSRGVGWRYGLPHQDRKKGQVKIPTKVEA